MTAFSRIPQSITEVVQRQKKILTNALSLAGTLLVTSGFGFVYWLVVARNYSLTEAGISSALVSAMMLLSTLGAVGLGTMLIGEIQKHRGEELSIILTTMMASGLSSFLIGLVFAILAPRLSTEFSILAADLFSFLLFVLGVAFSGMVLVLDQILLGMLRGSWQFIRNAIFSTGKLLILFLLTVIFSERSAISVYGTWVAGNLISLIALGVLMGKSLSNQFSFQLQWRTLWRMRILALSHHALNMALQFVQFALPIVVTISLSAEINAAFYAAWLIASSLFIIPSALTQSLFAVSAVNPSALPERLKFTMRASILGVTLGGAFVFMLTGEILGAFNITYQEIATPSLRILTVACLPMVVRTHFIAIHQVERKMERVALLFWTFSVCELAFAFVGGHYAGLNGLCIGWVAALYVEGLVMLPAVLNKMTYVYPDQEITTTEENLS